tara:strand:+ start:274 stop:708 length:435 start_codon:yes stop_codon:yes gene_type:complete
MSKIYEKIKTSFKYDMIKQMKRITLILALVCASASGAQTLEENVKTALAGTEERRARVMKLQMNRTFPPESVYFWHYENFALGCYYNNKRCAEADQGMIKLRNKAAEGIPKDFHWNVFILRRIYSLYSAHSENPRMGPAAKRPS